MRSCIFAGLLAFSFILPASAEQVWVTMDQVRSHKLEKAADSVIVGNPGIADIAVQDKNKFLLFGKAPGLTNIIVLDDNGETIENLSVRVNPPSSGMLVFHGGSNRTTYNCTNHCEATLTVGDANTNFASINSQIQTKLGQASNGENLEDLQEDN